MRVKYVTTLKIPALIFISSFLILNKVAFATSCRTPEVKLYAACSDGHCSDGFFVYDGNGFGVCGGNLPGISYEYKAFSIREILDAVEVEFSEKIATGTYRIETTQMCLFGGIPYSSDNDYGEASLEEYRKENKARIEARRDSCQETDQTKIERLGVMGTTKELEQAKDSVLKEHRKTISKYYAIQVLSLITALLANVFLLAFPFPMYKGSFSKLGRLSVFFMAIIAKGFGSLVMNHAHWFNVYGANPYERWGAYVSIAFVIPIFLSIPIIYTKIQEVA